MSKFQERQQAIGNGNHALVIGSGIAGLLAARVLLNHFQQITVIERDSLPEQPQPRPGVPQSAQSHGLLVRGQRILEQLFPGLNAQLIAAGAISVDWSADVLYLSSMGTAPRYASNLIAAECSRNLLEWAIRRRLTGCCNRLQFLEATQVKKLLTDESQSRIIGVQLRDRDNSQLGELTADLIVDASGRNSALPKWLEELGYSTPSETVIDAFFGYTTRWYERPADLQADWKILVVLPKPPHESRCGVLSPIEGDRWLLSLYGFGRDYPPTDEIGFLEFARTLHSPILYEAVKDAKPLSPVYSYRRTENRLRHYEQLSQFPEGIVALGDAVFAFNPYYGQGMTAAALSALVLDRCLHQRWKKSQNAPIGFGQHFQHQLVRRLKTPWLSATSSDRVWLTSEASIDKARKPNKIDQLLRQYVEQVMLLSMECPEVHRTTIEMYHMVKPSIALFQPNIAAKVLLQAWKRKTKPSLFLQNY
ncbi:2-polyprenyl-6-methoxyphenol hydroxylase-like oxidoreductase [cyanobacterium TDX16]|nr:2-polyprenyl-6-methoxyphenol hydroxylase-like oxidoreductase [cyanobacterium TDX16]